MGTASANSKETFEVAREELEVTKREVETGRVRVKTVIREEERLIEERLRRNEAQVERVAVDRIVAEPVEPRYEGDTLVIPVMEEVLVKQWRITEEVRIRRATVEVPYQRRVLLKTEDVVVERAEGRSGDPSPGAT